MAAERTVTLDLDEIEGVLYALKEAGHGKDGGDYEPECPTCTAAEKLKDAFIADGVPASDGGQG